MKFKTLKELVSAVKTGEISVTVFVDNDQVFALSDDIEVFDFDGEGPEDALIMALSELGLEAERV